MPKTNPDQPLCEQCGKRNATIGTPDPKICRHCWEVNKSLENLPVDLAQLKQAKDWLKLAEGLSETVEAIAKGEVKATAAQAGMIKSILDRAYGRPTKTQEDKAPAAGIIILPTLGFRENMEVCPNCGFEVGKEKEETDV